MTSKKVVRFKGNVSFSKAFSVAREELGADEFEFKGKRYNTLYDYEDKAKTKPYLYEIFYE